MPPKIILDGVFFQIGKSGIARLWKSYMEQWAKTDFGNHLVIIDRKRTAPRIEGLTYHDAPPFRSIESGKEMVQIEKWCRELHADVFVSTFYSTPIETRSVMMVYDMIHEIQSNGVRQTWEQEEKSLGIIHADHLVAISDNTAKDVQSFYPFIPKSNFSTVHCGVDPAFQPAAERDIVRVKETFDLKKPYFLIVGTRAGYQGYKNVIFPVRVLDGMNDLDSFDIVCVGGESTLGELSKFKNVSLRLLPHVSEDDLISLYSGAEALIYPSKYEGFGLPLIEAMACGCPVITCPNGSIPEVAGDAALYVENEDKEGMEKAVREVRKAPYRAELKSRGIERARLFSWEKAAQKLADILTQAASLPLKSERELHIWREFREQHMRLTEKMDVGMSGRSLKYKLGKYSVQLGIRRN